MVKYLCQQTIGQTSNARIKHIPGTMLLPRCGDYLSKIVRGEYQALARQRYTAQLLAWNRNRAFCGGGFQREIIYTRVTRLF